MRHIENSKWQERKTLGFAQTKQRRAYATKQQTMGQKSQLGSWRERETFWVCPNKQKGVRNKQQTMRKKKANQTHGESMKTVWVLLKRTNGRTQQTTDHETNLNQSNSWREHEHLLCFAQTKKKGAYATDNKPWDKIMPIKLMATERETFWVLFKRTNGRTYASNNKPWDKIKPIKLMTRAWKTFGFCSNKQKGVHNRQQTRRQNKANQTHGESVKPFGFCSDEQKRRTPPNKQVIRQIKTTKLIAREKNR